jgi:multidrug efflux pump subunit AcrA (membrane-fusion protein)
LPGIEPTFVSTCAASRARRLCWCLALIGLLAACTADAAPTVETLAVEEATVTQTISAPGSVEAADRQPVTASVPGVVARIRVEDGDTVEAGEVVVRLASDEVDLALEQAEAAQAALASSQSGVQVDPPGDAAVAAAQGSVAKLDADVKPDLAAARRKARKIDDEDERAAAEATIALLEEAYRDVRAALLAAGESAATQQNAVAASFSSALNQALGQASAGQAAQAAGAAESAAVRADDLKLRAPFSGVVSLGRAAPGATPSVPDDLAGAGAADALAGGLGSAGGEGARLRVGVPVSPAQPVFTVYDLSELYIRADVDEIDAPQLQVGQAAQVMLDAFPDQTFTGEVVEVAIEAQTSATGGVAYPIRIRMHDLPEDGPRVGMTASAQITTMTVRSDLTVPSRAIVRRGGGQAVFVVRDGTAVIVPIEVEALGEERAAVRSEQLRGDDQVIVTGYEDLDDGDAVTVEP